MTKKFKIKKLNIELLFIHKFEKVSSFEKFIRKSGTYEFNIYHEKNLVIGKKIDDNSRISTSHEIGIHLIWVKFSIKCYLM